jgi:ABC-2 type transport system ATP-binding protein
MNEVVLSVRDFRKMYGDHAGVAGISFEIGQGEIFGLLGPNGAGKTTTLECLEGIRKPDAGKLDILGTNPVSDPRKLRNLIGVQLQTSGLPASMTVDEAMKFFSAYHGVAPRDDLVKRLGLDEKKNSQYKDLSVGQQRRLALALAVAHKPPVIILDEPTAGLDVSSRTELHALMSELRAAGTTILMATHDMAEAEKMADRVAILLNGRVVTTGTPLEITATGSSLTKISISTENSILCKNGTGFPAVQKRVNQEEYTVLFSTDPGPTVSAVIEYIQKNNDRLIDLRVERPTLEERFLEITQNGDSK